MVRARELFILWAALNREAMKNGAFIASHLAEHAKPTSRVVIVAGGIITALSRTLDYGDRIDCLPVLRTPSCIDLTTCLNMHLFKTVGVGQLWLNHHVHALFALSNPAKTTITRPSNLLYDDDVNGEPGVGRVAMMMTVMMMMMMPRMHLEYVVLGGRLLQVPAVPHLALRMLLLLRPWVHSCFRWFLTVSTSYKFRTRRSCVTSRTWPIWFIMHMSTISGHTRLLIGTLTVPWGRTD